MAISYSIYLITDRYNSYNTPSTMALSEKCVYATSDKDKANEVFDKYKEKVKVNKEKLELKETRQYIYMIKNNPDAEFNYTIRKYGYKK